MAAWETKMDSSFSIKPRPGARKAYAPRDPVPVRGAVETDLDTSRSVAATGDGTGKHGDPRSNHPARELVVDPDNQEKIFRQRDVRASEREHPDQALQRRRAYASAKPGSETAKPDENHADIEA
jgi:hypothetical protein